MTTSFISLIGFLTMLQVSSGGGLAPAKSPSTGPPSASGTGSSGASLAPSTTGLSPAAGQTITLTLDQVVNFAIQTNTNVVLAKQRLAEAGESVNQINAQGKPQINSDLADTYSSFPENEASYGPVVANPTVPTGTTIPTLTDEAANFSTTFGLGTVSSATAFGAATGAPLDSTGTGTTLPAANASVPGGSSTTALPGVNSGTSTSGAISTGPVTGSGISPASSSSGSVGASTPGTTPGFRPSTSTGAGGGATRGSGLSSTGASSTGTSFNLLPMPQILQDYVTESAPPEVVTEQATAKVAPSPSAAEARTAAVEHADQAGGTGTTGATGTTGTTGTSSTTSTISTISEGNSKVNNYGARVNLSQYIDAFGLLSAARDAEKETTRFYAIDVDRTQNEVALSAKDLFFNVVLAQAEVAVEQEQVNDATESVRVTAALVQQGQAAGFDLLSAQTTLANDQELLASAQNQQSFAVADLDYLLGIKPDTPINLTVPPLPPLNQPVNLNQSTSAALQRRPEIIQAEQNVAIAQKLVKVASEGTTPTIGLVGTYGYNSTSSVTNPQNEGLVSAQVQVPFDDGGATRSRVREAKDALQTQLTTRDEERLNVTLEVRQAYLNILTAQTQATTAQTGVNLAVETLRVANVQYQNGLGTILDVENAQAQLATARTNLADAEYSYQTALATLMRDIGSR